MSDQMLREFAEDAGLKDLDLLQLAEGDTHREKLDNLHQRFPGAFLPTRDAVLRLSARHAAERVKADLAEAAAIGDVRKMTREEYQAAQQKMLSLVGRRY